MRIRTLWRVPFRGYMGKDNFFSSISGYKFMDELETVTSVTDCHLKS